MRLAKFNICHACGQLTVKGNTELHHFPIPKRLGGEAMIPLCNTCHDMVDRINLEEWPVESLVEAWEGIPLMGRLMILKLAGRINPGVGHDET